MTADAAEREAFERHFHPSIHGPLTDEQRTWAYAGWQKARAALPARAPEGSGIQAERQAWIDAADALIESLQEGIMTDAGIKQSDREKMRAQIDALDALKQERAAMLSASPPPPEPLASPAPGPAEPVVKALEQLVEEFYGSIQQYDKIGPDFTHKDGTEVFHVSVLLDRRELLEDARRILSALAQPAPAYETCPSCGGHGMISTGDDIVMCGECKSNGVVPVEPAPAPVASVEEAGWLIELKGTCPKWWRVGGGIEPDWTADASQALRFARKQDAESYIDDIGWTEAFASEHIWCGARIINPPPAPVAAQPQPSAEIWAWQWRVIEDGEPRTGWRDTDADRAFWERYVRESTRACSIEERPLYTAPPPASDERVAEKDWRENDLDIVILSERRNAAAAMRERCARAVYQRSAGCAEIIRALPLDGEG